MQAHFCCECRKRQSRAVPFRRLADRAFRYVCPHCWHRFDYAAFFWPDPLRRLRTEGLAQ